MLKIDLKNIRAYGDRLNDGAIQMSFTLPIRTSPEAKEAARSYAAKLGLEDVNVVWMEPVGSEFTFFIVYGRARHSVDMRRIRVPKVDAPILDYKSLVKFMEEKLDRPLVVIGACTGHDAHTVGIDAIFNMKGFDMDYGLERYPLFKAINLRSQVDNRLLVRRAVELGADAILVSQVVTQRDSHVKNLRELIAIMMREKGLKPHVIKIVGGPRIDHALARKLGFDAGFGAGTRPSQVASYIVHEYLKRAKSGVRGLESEAVGRRCKRTSNRANERTRYARHRRYIKSPFEE